MNILNAKEKELIEVAESSSDEKLLSKLAESVIMRVRRAVARNLNTSVETLSLLSFDKVQNVAYMATNNPNCKVTREFEDKLPPCVTCSVKESNLNCLSCKLNVDFYSTNF